MPRHVDRSRTRRDARYLAAVRRQAASVAARPTFRYADPATLLRPGDTVDGVLGSAPDAEAAFDALVMDDTCGDCVTGRCHWGGDRSRASEAAVAEGGEYVDPVYGRCGCARHRASILARPFVERYGVNAAPVAWCEAKRLGLVVVEHD